MYSHNMVGSNDLEASKKFYDATFQAIGGKPAIVDDKGRLIYMHNGGLFLVGTPIDGEPASVGNGCKPAYQVANRTLPPRAPSPGAGGRKPQSSSAVNDRIGAIQRTMASATWYIAVCALRRPRESPGIV